VAPVAAPEPQPAPGQQQHEVTIQYQQAAPPTGPAAPVEVPLGVTTTKQFAMMYDEDDEEPPRYVYCKLYD